ncbi:MAG TPA: redox-sensing transcriptional repressor Rex [Longimicrobiaceae bacterium]|nr:redox-sensing transcriptional repressor Rex [Longimicrobiaceae bacterium]
MKHHSPEAEGPRFPDSTIRRLSLYLRFLQEADRTGAETISSSDLATRGGTTSAQVRKDLSLFGSFGKRGLGYSVPELLRELHQILGVDRPWRVGLIGAGKLGSALSSYEDFRRRGFEIRAVFDSDPQKIGKRWGEVHVIADADLEKVLERESIEIVMIAVPAGAAQALADRVVASGVHAILNFAPIRLRTPDDVALRNVDMAVEMEGLSFALTNR